MQFTTAKIFSPLVCGEPWGFFNLEIMIKELRIGNYVSITPHSDNCTMQLNEKKFENLIIFKTGDRVKPIPLTEEWLLKFGWGKGEFDTEYIDNTSLKQEVLSYNVNANMLCIESNYDIIEIGHIKHVHQLQNLYFALCEKELQLQ